MSTYNVYLKQVDCLHIYTHTIKRGGGGGTTQNKLCCSCTQDANPTAIRK